MTRRKSNLGRRTRRAEAVRRMIVNQTEEERALANQRSRQRMCQIRAEETAERPSCTKRKGPPRKHPMRNRLSKAQRLRRAREKEAKMKCESLNCRTTCSITERYGVETCPLLLDDCLTGMKEATKQKLPPVTQPIPNRSSEAQSLRHAREKEAKMIWESLNCGTKCSIKERYGVEICPLLLNDCLTGITKGRKRKGPPRKHPMRNRLSKAQRLRRAREKEAKMKLLNKAQLNIEHFQDSQDITDRYSIPSTSREILNSSEENKSTSDFSQNLIIVDSFSVIKTEIIDPSEKNEPFFQNDSQCVTILDSKPVVDSSRTNTKIILPNVNIEPLVKTESPDENLNSFGTNEKFPLTNVKQEHTDELTKSDRTKKGTLKKKAMVKRLCGNYVALVQQDDAHQLSLCKTDNHTLPENIKDIEKFKLNPNFGKINYNMNKVDNFADQCFWNVVNVLNESECTFFK